MGCWVLKGSTGKPLEVLGRRIDHAVAFQARSGDSSEQPRLEPGEHKPDHTAQEQAVAEELGES